jgi:hypothetical protein
LDGCWFRSAAISCALASCALVAGPGFAGIALAHADLFGFDFFGDEDKSDMHHPRPGSEISAQSTRIAAGQVAAPAPTAKIGSAPENAVVPESTAMRTTASAPEGVVITQAVGGGSGGVAGANAAGRAANLPRVSSAPVTRSIVIRRSPQAATAAPAYVPPAPQSPAVVALAAPPPESGEPEAMPQPAGPLAPSPTAPQAKDPLAPGISVAARVPDSYRVGYAEYLRAADTGDLFLAALPGAAGITGFTLVGAYAGYRQARALQRALLAPAPTSFLL